MGARLAVLAALVALTLARPALGEETASGGPPPGQNLYLEVSVNGWPRELVTPFREEQGRLSLTVAELREIGLLPDGSLVDVRSGDARIYLDQIPGLSWTVDHKAQSIDILAPSDRIRPEEVSISPPPEAVEAETDWGALFAYDLYGEWALSEDDQTYGRSLNGDLELRVISPFGIASSSSSLAVSPGQTQVVRLETYAEASNSQRVLTFRAGDGYSGALAWTRSVRYGGVQLRRNFGLRPDLVTTPLPQFREGVAAPSAVDLLINGVEQYSGRLDPGAVLFTDLPTISGVNRIRLVITEEGGRRREVVLPLYTSSELLGAGVSDFSLETGFERQRYGTLSADYGPWFASASVRRGLSDEVTWEGHGELAGSFAAAGVGLAAGVRDWFGVRGLIAASMGKAGRGVLWGLGLERYARRLSFSARYEETLGTYQDLPALFGEPHPTRNLTLTAGLDLHPAGAFNVAYVKQRTPTQRSQIVSGGYGVDLFGQVLHIDVSGYADLRERGQWGVMLNVSLQLGSRTTISAGGSRDSEQHNRYLEARGEAFDERLRWEGRLARGAVSGARLEAEWRGPRGEVTVRGLEAEGSKAIQAELAQSIVLFNNAVFLAGRIDDAFTVVQVDDTPGVEVFRENRTVGRTGRNGRLFVNDLRGYEANHISIDPEKLPLGAETPTFAQRAAPTTGGGVVTRFAVNRDLAALVVLRLADGSAPPVGARVEVEGLAEPAVMGFDGEVYLRGLRRGKSRLRVSWRDGACTAGIDADFPAGALPRVGPIPCGR